MQTQADACHAFVEVIKNRLRRHYAERTPLPDRHDGETLSLAILQVQTAIYERGVT